MHVSLYHYRLNLTAKGIMLMKVRLHGNLTIAGRGDMDTLPTSWFIYNRPNPWDTLLL